MFNLGESVRYYAVVRLKDKGMLREEVLGEGMVCVIRENVYLVATNMNEIVNVLPRDLTSIEPRYITCRYCGYQWENKCFVEEWRIHKC